MRVLLFTSFKNGLSKCTIIYGRTKDKNKSHKVAHSFHLLVLKTVIHFTKRVIWCTTCKEPLYLHLLVPNQPFLPLPSIRYLLWYLMKSDGEKSRKGNENDTDCILLNNSLIQNCIIATSIMTYHKGKKTFLHKTQMSKSCKSKGIHR